MCENSSPEIKPTIKSSGVPKIRKRFSTKGRDHRNIVVVQSEQYKKNTNVGLNINGPLAVMN